jgi:chromosome segregation ATPase
MGILKQYVELKPYNSTIKDIRNEIKNLRKLLLEKPDDNSNAAKNALSKCTEYKNRCEEREQKINDIHQSIISQQLKVNEELKSIEHYRENIAEVNNLSLETKKL